MKHQILKTTSDVSKRMKMLSHKTSKTESILAKALWHKGYRYRLNYKNLPGTPDIVLIKYKIAIFVDGEFWHGKDFDKQKEKLKSNKDFWIEKIQENIDRDKRNDTLLHQMGWISLHFWSKDVFKDVEHCINEIEDYIYAQILGMNMEKE